MRKLRGDAAEETRVGNALPARPSVQEGESAAPPLLLAETWDLTVDPTGWWLSEKLDGVRAFWDGKQFLSRQGNLFHAPDWFVAGLPSEPLDGEFWLGRKKFQRAVSIVRRQDKSELWKECLIWYSTPKAREGLRESASILEECTNSPAALRQNPCPSPLQRRRSPPWRAHAAWRSLAVKGSCASPDRVTRLGVVTLRKLKSFHDAEARVVVTKRVRAAQGRLALLVELEDGTKFAVGTGFSNAERENAPPVGSVITFRYQELSEGGVPRFPSYVGVREVVTAPVVASRQSAKPTSKPVAGVRRFTFAEGSADKFWEISMSGTEVTVRYGRTGTNGQTNAKSFPSEDAAAKHVAKLCAEKIGKGYKESAG